MKQNKALYKFVNSLARPFARFFYPYEVRGLDKVTNLNSGHIICCNHLSNIDPVFLSITYDKPIFFMAKVELFKCKLFGKFLSALGVFPVNRGKGDHKAIELADDILHSGKVLGIFIEGTRSKTGEFLRPKSGVTVLSHKNLVPIVPVCITGGGKNNKIRMFKKTVIEYGKPIMPEELCMGEIYTRLELKRATTTVMDRIRKLRK